MTTPVRIEAEVYQIQHDPWSGSGGRMVQPPGWRPVDDDERVVLEWEQDGVEWRAEGRWADLQAAMRLLGIDRRTVP